MKLILKSILVCVIILGGYHVLFKRLPYKWRAGGPAGSQGELNLMKAQEFYYMGDSPRVVMCGSSISNRLRDLPAGWYNLSLANCNVFTPLDVLVRSGKKPKYVLIETNVLVVVGEGKRRGDADEGLLSSLFYPGLSNARRRLPELWEASKPHHVLLRALNAKLSSPAATGRLAVPSLAPDVEPEPAHPVTITDEVWEDRIRRREALLARPLDDAEREHALKLMKKYVADLEARGCTVIFYEVPEQVESHDRPLPISIRTMMHEAFPSPRYRWVPEVEVTEYRTTDTVHLTTRSATKYVAILKQFMASIEEVTTSTRATTRPAH